MYLEQINNTNDIKSIPAEGLAPLASEIRDFLVEKISKSGGHLGANLGVVELTMAMHLALDLPKDKIVFDVGHQSYTHKILTGRKEGFDELRKFKGMSGFPKTSESECDVFNTGHSSTSISAGLGLVKARDLKGTDETIISVIGDGALTGGMAFEALNNAAKLESNFIIILNDNNMSISENVGGMSKYLDSIRTSNTYLNLKDGVYNLVMKKNDGENSVRRIRRFKNFLKTLVVPGMLFENMGITYLGPVDGHDVKAVCRAIEEAKRFRKCVLIHAITEKGRGYEPAIKHPSRFHGTEPFDVTTGVPLNTHSPNYTDIFSTVMLKMASRHPDVVAITAAMPDGTGLKRYKSSFPERFFDVGIAEQHAVTFAAGLAAGGMRPVVAVYSSFLQRAYDQIIHDVCIQNLPVIFAIDRAGLVGSDGETHQGIFDISYLSEIPNMTVMAPKNKWELSDMMKFAYRLNAPVAIRYPRGEAYCGLADHRDSIEMGKAEPIVKEEGVLLFALGSMVKTAMEVHDALAEHGISSSVVNARFAKPLDVECIADMATNHHLIVTMEENVLRGGFGEHLCAELERCQIQREVLNIGVDDEYVEQGSQATLRQMLKIDAAGVTEQILKKLGK